LFCKGPESAGILNKSNLNWTVIID
jgi:hypothetical protein